MSRIKAEKTPRYCQYKMSGCLGLIPMEYIGGKNKAEKDYKKLTSCANPACATRSRQENNKASGKVRTIQVELDNMHLWLMADG